jgi:hypothetical protein
MVERHERLKIWQKSYDLAKDLMQVTERFPRPQQRDGLASEIRPTARIADDLLLRMEATMSKNQISEHLGISKATLYEWRKQEQIE